MTKQERITKFVSELADLCERYDVEIATESMCDWSAALSDDTSYHAIIPTFALLCEIRRAEIISPSEC